MELTPEDRDRIYNEEKARRDPPGQMTDLCAVLSAACGLLGMIAFPILAGPAALLLAVCADARARNNPRLGPRWLKWLGFWLGLLECIAVGVVMYQAQEALSKFGSG
ncbi:MAG TPA: hypothetical protein VGN26_08330 [Armatimonadota bacterium]|jgi:hypothetical protein